MKNNLIIKSSFCQLTERSGTVGGELKSNWGDLIRTPILAECMDGDYLWLTEARSIPLLKWIIDEKKIITYENFRKLPSNLEIYNADNYVPNKNVFNQLDGNWHGYIWDKEKLVAQNDKILETESYAEPKLDQTWQQSLVEGMGFLADGVVYDVSGRHTVGDNLTKGWTRIQRTFFKYNLLSWWTNTLKENSMLGMANYYAKQKNLSFDKLNKPLQEFFALYNIDSVKWDVIRKNGMAKADDGTEFINIANLDQISDADIKRITGIDNLSKTELQIEKDKFKYSVSGILLDRSIYAVIEPDARVKGIMTQGLLAGTGMGEAIRFVGQFKAFPMSIMNKVLGREMAYIRKGKISHKDNLGNNGEIKEGQVQVMSAGSGITHSEYNLSSEETLLFQIWIEPNKNNIKPTWKNINLANNNKAIEILASGELKYEQSDTLKIQQDASVIRIVGEKDIIKYKLHKNRHYYGVVSEGLVNINNINKINSRDGFYIQSEDQIDFNFLKSSEIILVDMPKII